ncbi:hypothetical protein V8V91_25840 [Algoriphagus halophilus]|uniref:hypothetical protein n=1 Tax=Algoriphagus halophilus TaxID=226505 RepID=UPI00358FF0B9
MVCRETFTEGSETANLGSNEQESGYGGYLMDEVAHHTDVQRLVNQHVLRW